MILLVLCKCSATYNNYVLHTYSLCIPLAVMFELMFLALTTLSLALGSLE